MTIKEFAKLCNCNPQTLRYYDKEDLLKPNKVDEFGISKEYYQKIMERTNEIFELAAQMSQDVTVEYHDVKDCAEDDVQEEERYTHPLENDAYAIVYEKHGWGKTKEVLDELPELEEEGEYLYHFEVKKEKVSEMTFNMAVCNILIGYVLDRNQGKHLQLGCNCTDAKDNENHFWLLKAKA